MNNENKENFEELFGRFVDKQQAAKAAENICRGDELFSANPAPEMSDETVKRIQSQMTEKLAGEKRGNFRGAFYKTAVAAVILFVATIGAVKLLESQTQERIVTIAGRDVFEVDDNIDVITAEVEEIEKQIAKLRLGESSDNEVDVLSDLEVEIIETSGTFWKG